MSYACIWATIYFAVCKMGSLIPKYGSHMPLLIQLIHNIISIYIGDLDRTTWEEFKEETNNFWILSWEFVDPVKSVDFLNLTISIKHNKIVTRTYQKAVNLCQYISPISNHSPKMMKGIIISLLKNYKNQNTFEKHYLDMALKLFTRQM